MQEDFLTLEHAISQEADLRLQHQEVHVLAVLLQQRLNDVQSLVVLELAHQHQGFDVLLPLAVGQLREVGSCQAVEAVIYEVLHQRSADFLRFLHGELGDVSSRFWHFWGWLNVWIFGRVDPY